MWSSNEIAELTWENGELGMKVLNGEGRDSETLESIVQQATCQNHYKGEKRGPETPSLDGLMKKRTRSESAEFSVNGSNCMELSLSDDMTTYWANSFDSISPDPTPSFNHRVTFEDSAASIGGSENQLEEEGGERERSRGRRRRRRAASVHNQSERRRRDRINEKMKALQKLVPNASKRDKASMLDEVIAYLKQLQSQIQVMSTCATARHNNFNININMMQHPLPLHLHMSLLARMAIGFGMPPTSSTPTTTSFLPPPFLLPSPPPPTQTMNIEVYNKMAQLYLHQINRTTQTSNQ